MLLVLISVVSVCIYMIISDIIDTLDKFIISGLLGPISNRDWIKDGKI